MPYKLLSRNADTVGDGSGTKNAIGNYAGDPSPFIIRAQPGEHLILSQGAASCQRSVRFGDHICIRTYHDGLHGLPDVMLFDVAADPHQLNDLTGERPDLVAHAMVLLEDWHGRMMRTASHPRDPMWTVLHAGGPGTVRGHLEAYLKRLRATGRDAFADLLEASHVRKEANMLARLRAR